VLEIPDVETHTPTEEHKSSPFDIAIGILLLLMILPVASFAMRELSDIADSLEYGADTIDILNSIIYSLTTVSILLVLGLYFLGAIKTKVAKVASGITLISISMVNVLCRIGDFSRELQRNREWGWDGSMFDYLSWPSTHERIELALLGAIVGLLIMKK
tara:strand:- start:1203 stop:1679 length:477 start_codon:yes stop_codon:yes gene_type:complete